MPSRSFLIAAFLVILGTAYAAYWHLMADRLEQGIERWAEEQRSHGLEADWTDFVIDGFPLRLRARFTTPRLIRRDGALPWSWQGDSLTLETQPWWLTRIRFSGSGKQTVQAAGQQIVFERLEGTARIGAHGRIVEAESRLSRLVLTPPAGGTGATADTLRLAFQQPAEAPRGHTAPGLTAEVALGGLILATRQKLPVEGPADMTVRAAIMGAVPAPPGQQTLAAWRDAGGTLEVERLTLDWSPLKLSASGTLALDHALQPIGALTTQLSGHAALLDRLTAMGWVQPQDARIAGIAFGLLEKPGADGKPVLKAPVTVQDGYLFIGPARLAPMPRIVWR